VTSAGTPMKHLNQLKKQLLYLKNNHWERKEPQDKTRSMKKEKKSLNGLQEKLFQVIRSDNDTHFSHEELREMEKMFGGDIDLVQSITQPHKD